MTKYIVFAKFHSLGNDFLLAGSFLLPHSLSKFARAILDRHTGIGADGLVVMMSPRNKKHHARLRFFNADGSEAEMSGNGIRCACALLADRSPARRRFLIETPAGLKSLEKLKGARGKWLFRVGMGAPVLDPAKIPFKAGAFPVPIKGYPLRTQQGVLPVTVTSMGNPHCSVFVRSFDPPVPCAAGVGPNGPSPACGPKPFGGRRPEGGFGPQGGVWPGASAAGPYDLGWEGLGREIETNPLFPNRTNVEFVKVISRKEIAVQFWERGVGHTMSSGTGACAATVASILNGLTERQVRVQTQAGSLLVAWPENGEVILTGLVERIAQGTYNYEF